MTNTAASKIAFSYIQASAAPINFEPSRLVMRDEDTFRRLAINAVYFLVASVSNGCDDEEERTEGFEPLNVEFFRNAENGEYIADVDLTVGGPSIWARYESRRDRLTIFAHWGADELEFIADESPLIDWIKDAEECTRF